MECSHCRGENNDNKKFCRHCGSSLLIVKDIFCSNCGTKSEANSKFCEECGNGLQQNPDQRNKFIQPSKKQAPNKFMAFILIIFVGIGAYYGIKSFGKISMSEKLAEEWIENNSDAIAKEFAQENHMNIYLVKMIIKHFVSWDYTSNGNDGEHYNIDATAHLIVFDSLIDATVTIPLDVDLSTETVVLNENKIPEFDVNVNPE